MMAIEGPDILQIEKKEGNRIYILTINRTERGNRFSPELIMRLTDAWEEFRVDENALVAIVTSAGEEHFCIGPDFNEIHRAQKGEIPKRKSMPWGIPRFYPYEIWKPVIAAINGDAYAGGFMLANECDIRISAEHAQFAITEAMWNWKGPWVGDLTRAMHLGHALEMALWGDSKYGAKRMYEMGWINRVVPKEQLMDETMSWARRMLDLAPTTLQNFKQIIYRGLYEPSERSREFAVALEANLVGTKDTEEGVKAYLENRKPCFDGKRAKVS